MRVFANTSRRSRNEQPALGGARISACGASPAVSWSELFASDLKERPVRLRPATASQLPCQPPSKLRSQLQSWLHSWLHSQLHSPFENPCPLGLRSRGVGGQAGRNAPPA